MIVPSAPSINAIQKNTARGEAPIRPPSLKLLKPPGVPRVPGVNRYISFRAPK